MHNYAYAVRCPQCGQDTRPQAWQENWRIREAGSEEGFSIAALQSVPPPLSGDWLAAQKTAFRTKREQAFGAGRIGDCLAPDGVGKFQRIDRGFSFLAGQAISTTYVARLPVVRTEIQTKFRTHTAWRSA